MVVVVGVIDGRIGIGDGVLTGVCAGSIIVEFVLVFDEARRNERCSRAKAPDPSFADGFSSSLSSSSSIISVSKRRDSSGSSFLYSGLVMYQCSIT